MKIFFCCIGLLMLLPFCAVCQTAVADTGGIVLVQKDSRIDLLGQKMADYNKSLSLKAYSTKGFRLMLLSTSDRSLAMQVRSKLLQQYPDEGIYMSYQTPYIKLKFGNFESREEADKIRKSLLSQKIVPGNIYIVPEMIEVKPKSINLDTDTSQ
ncbi:MAG: SPOR domain-containing protein [Niastella sp.]|nr:SPOR domain-containing protein [Niastella sp.]